jgi:glucose-1-phosphate adenylyltransferase
MNNRVKTLVVVLAGGAGGRLELLTHERAKPAVSFAGTHRLIDFPLSNCLNAGLSDVWIAQQFNPISLSDHLASGRPWDLDRTSGGLIILQPRMGHDDRGGFPTGTADVLWRNAPMIREFAPEALVVVSADAIYKLDYGSVVDAHAESGAAVTMVTTEVEPGDAGRYGVVRLDGEKVTEYVYKPDDPAANVISNEVFVFSPGEVLDRLDEIAEASEELEDVGDALLPALVEDGRVRAHPFEGYWRDVGTIDAFHGAHMEQLEHPPPIDLDDPEWPVLTHAASRRESARVVNGATVEQSLLATAATVAGTVGRSVIGRGAVVEEGAVVRDSVVLPGAVIRSGATVERAIVDDRVRVERDVRVGERDGELALVGLQATVEQDVPAGGRFPEVDDG